MAWILYPCFPSIPAIYTEVHTKAVMRHPRLACSNSYLRMCYLLTPEKVLINLCHQVDISELENFKLKGYLIKANIIAKLRE
jgi:hypothetical protein